MGKVLIKCIQTPMQKYFYDRSLDSVVMVNDEEYQILKTVEKTKLVPDGVLRRFVKSGLLRETAIEEIEHPETENLHLLAEHYMGNLMCTQCQGHLVFYFPNIWTLSFMEFQDSYNEFCRIKKFVQ